MTKGKGDLIEVNKITLRVLEAETTFSPFCIILELIVLLFLDSEKEVFLYTPNN